MPPAATKSKYGKNLKSYILTPPDPQGHRMSVKCEEPIDELTVQVWLLYDHPNIALCKRDGIKDGRSDYYMPQADLSGQGHKNATSTLFC